MDYLWKHFKSWSDLSFCSKDCGFSSLPLFSCEHSKQRKEVPVRFGTSPLGSFRYALCAHPVFSILCLLVGTPFSFRGQTIPWGMDGLPNPAHHQHSTLSFATTGGQTGSFHPVPPHRPLTSSKALWCWGQVGWAAQSQILLLFEALSKSVR